MSGVLSLGLSLTGQYLRFLAVCLLFAVFSGCSQTGQVSTPSSSPKQKLAAAPSLNAPTPRSTQFNPLPLPLRIVYPIRYDQGIERKGEILAVSNSAEEIARIFKKRNMKSRLSEMARLFRQFLSIAFLLISGNAPLRKRKNSFSKWCYLWR